MANFTYLKKNRQYRGDFRAENLQCLKQHFDQIPGQNECIIWLNLGPKIYKINDAISSIAPPYDYLGTQPKSFMQICRILTLSLSGQQGTAANMSQEYIVPRMRWPPVQGLQQNLHPMLAVQPSRQCIQTGVKKLDFPSILT